MDIGQIVKDIKLISGNGSPPEPSDGKELKLRLSQPEKNGPVFLRARDRNLMFLYIPDVHLPENAGFGHLMQIPREIQHKFLEPYYNHNWQNPQDYLSAY